MNERKSHVPVGRLNRVLEDRGRRTFMACSVRFFPLFEHGQCVQATLTKRLSQRFILIRQALQSHLDFWKGDAWVVNNLQ